MAVRSAHHPFAPVTSTSQRRHPLLRCLVGAMDLHLLRELQASDSVLAESANQLESRSLTAASFARPNETGG